VTSSVLLIDDHPAILLGLECIFSAEPDFEVVGAVQDPRASVATFTRTLPDLVVLDLSMPGRDGETVMGELRMQECRCRILVLTSSVEPATVKRVMRAGADGYQLKDSPAASLVEAARSVLRGESPIDARMTRALLGLADRVEPLELTPRERDVLRLVSLGLANKQIAVRLAIGESTVKTHLSSVFQQIGVSDRTSAAMWARTHLGEDAGH
jgi:DNA-binding NarL/FixJ family response regulator